MTKVGRGMSPQAQRCAATALENLGHEEKEQVGLAWLSQWRLARGKVESPSVNTVQRKLTQLNNCVR